MPKSRKIVEFTGENQQKLAGVLEFPIDQKPYAFGIFIHCFTCGKNVSAARHITRALTQSGIAVLRFDLTGIGESQGDFASTTFQSNIRDVKHASEFLKKEYKSPQLLIGHSLGGAAALSSAFELPGIEAIVTIGSPSSPDHVLQFIQNDENGSPKIRIGALTLDIENQFIETIQTEGYLDRLSKLKKPLLIMHSPQDEVVSVDHAAELYQHAFHPKSFVSLDGSNHMLSKRTDAAYAGQIIGTWVSKYLPKPSGPNLDTDHQVVAASQSDHGFTTFMQVGIHQLVADEPADAGGTNYGPSPYELLSSALASCTAMTVKMYADRKKWDLEECRVHVDHQKKHAQDTASDQSKIDLFHRTLEIIGDLDQDQRNRLLEIANKCPVHRTLESQSIKVETKLE